MHVNAHVRIYVRGGQQWPSLARQLFWARRLSAVSEASTSEELGVESLCRGRFRLHKHLPFPTLRKQPSNLLSPSSDVRSRDYSASNTRLCPLDVIVQDTMKSATRRTSSIIWPMTSETLTLLRRIDPRLRNRHKDHSPNVDRSDARRAGSALDHLRL